MTEDEKSEVDDLRTRLAAMTALEDLARYNLRVAESRALAAEAEAKRLREALERPDMDALIALLDKHADRAMEYLRMDGDAVPTDTDTRAVIWNEMSALMGEYARAALKEPR